MKKILYIALVVSYLSAANQDTQNHSATQLEMFLFKIGFTSLLNDFKNQKGKVDLNSNDIEKLKADVRYLLKQMNKNKFQEIASGSNKVVNNDNNTQLLQDIKTLKEELKQLKSTIKSNKNTIRNSIAMRARLAVDTSNITLKPSFDSKIIKKIKRSQLVYIKSCSKFGWCELVGGGYIAKFKLKFL
jgi:type I site-specific restriction endonuclease